VVKGAGYLPSIFTKCHPSHNGLALNMRQGIPKSFLLQHSRNLSELITPELTQTLAGQVTRKKFRLIAIEKDLQFLEEEGFPLPETISLDQWEQLMLLENTFARNKYFDVMFTENNMEPLKDEQFEKILEDDKSRVGPLRLDQEMIDQAAKKTKISPDRMSEVLSLLKETHDDLIQDGHRLVSTLEQVDYEQLFDPSYWLSKPALARTLKFVTGRLVKQSLDLVKKRVRQSKIPDGRLAHKKQIEEEKHIFYGLAGNSIHLRVLNKELTEQDDWKVIREFHSWGQPLVIDLNFVKNLTYQAAMSLMDREIPMGLHINRSMSEPLAVYITSYDQNCQKCRLLEKALNRIKNEAWQSLPYHLTSEHYSALFPRKRLMILSPDSRNDLIDYDPNDIYVIGGIVEKVNRNKSTLNFALDNEIRHARFPMKRIIGIQDELNVDTAIGVIADFKNYKDWFHAFRWIPPRKLKNRLHGDTYTPLMEAEYIAHLTLSPAKMDQSEEAHQKLMMGTKLYKEAYTQIVKEMLKDVRNPRKHVTNYKYQSKPRRRHWRNDDGSAIRGGENNDYEEMESSRQPSHRSGSATHPNTVDLSSTEHNRREAKRRAKSFLDL